MKRMVLTTLVLGLFFSAQLALADWTAPRHITWVGQSGDAKIVADSSGKIHVVWVNNAPGNNEIYYKRSEDGGTTWSASQRLTWHSAESRSPAIAIDSSGTINIVWTDRRSGNGEIYHRASTDGGVTWTTPKRLTWTSGSSVVPSITIDADDMIHVVWADYTPGVTDIFYKRSTTPGGTAWNSAKRLSWTSDYSEVPAIAAISSSGILVVWADYTPDHVSPDLYIKRSTDGGATWTTSKRMTWTSGYSFNPAMAIDSSDIIHLVWSDWGELKPGIYHKSSQDGGSAWSAIENVTLRSGAFPSIAIDSNSHIHLAWDELTEKSRRDIFYQKSTDGGSTWTTFERVTWTSTMNTEFGCAMAIDPSNTIHLVWDDYWDHRIYYIKSK